MSTTEWPVKRSKGLSLVVSRDASMLSAVFKEGSSWVTLPLGLDVDPTDGFPLVERDEQGRIRRLADTDLPEWSLTAEWDTQRRQAFATYEDAVEHARLRSDP